MLKRLELIGFKSFAEKTRFDFAPGITAIVGPNGSGKSNIVDAVKWILGEQSAKSLRGGEMADVIFNGSSTRKPFGMAEVTMTFDNSKRLLQFDGDEVQITRRVYRDGQGEYLINGEVSRLKDIREMFLGSGAGHHAYSIIEQGRVDALLTASTKDRRVIFEEAAGISRFKARKIEALRKLEATEANLNRVRDILQELEKSLKTLHTQASKAKKYEELHARLKDLRVTAGRHEFREIGETLAYQEEVLARLREDQRAAAAKIEASEESERRLDAEATRIEDALRGTEKLLGEARQQIAEQEAAARNQRELMESLEQDRLRLGRQRAELQRRLRHLRHEAATVAQDAETAETEAKAAQLRADAAAAALNVTIATIAELSRQMQTARDEQFALVGRAAKLKTASEMSAAQVERLQKELVRKKAEGEKAAAEAAAIRRVMADLTQTNDELQKQLTAAKAALAELQDRQSEHRRAADALQPRLDALRDRRGDLRGRIEVLEELEKSLEGLGAGVRFVLERAHDPPIIGLVADLLTVPNEFAPLIDLALGEAAQRFIIRDATEIDLWLTTLGELPGRVGFIPLPSVGTVQTIPIEPTTSHGIRIDASNDRPDHDPRTVRSPLSFVTSEWPGLVEHLLGNVVMVDTLTEAREHAVRTRGYRYVTRRGEILEPDGTVILGPARVGGGILSRKSELRDLREQAMTLEADVTRLEQEQTQYRQLADALDTEIAGCGAEITALAAKVSDLRDSLAAQREKQARLADLVELVSSETAILEGELTKARAALETTSSEAAAAEQSAAEWKTVLESAEMQYRQAEETRVLRQEEHTNVQVALGRAREQAAALTARAKAARDELSQIATDEAALGDTDATLASRIAAAQLAALRAAEAAATAYHHKDIHESAVADYLTVRHEIRARRDQSQLELKLIRDEWTQRQDQAHAHELTVRDLTNRRASIVDRIKEDYGIDLAVLEPLPVTDTSRPSEDEMHAEIEDLKRKITRLGSVNLEALEQLAAEEARQKALRAELHDLTTAEKSLLEIIETINTDSRRLFTETLSTVRSHFQELFRKLFAGGMADIVLEDPTDVLESGIEITARPPGKELRSITLLSGGEKTLTAVALLLAIFRSKPSPFCLLDEVDAALDEHNTAQLAIVLREFLDQSQFIIVTHKKRTMATADVLYGITMQESGVSKQVATRIEDWPDEEARAA